MGGASVGAAVEVRPMFSSKLRVVAVIGIIGDGVPLAEVVEFMLEVKKV